MRNAAQLAAVVLAIAIAAPAAAAKPVTLKGLVVGQPYTVKKRTAVPVLLDAKNARRARLASRVGVLHLKAKRVKAPRRTRIATAALRLNDRIRTRARIRRGARRAGYWQISTRALVVRKRSKTLSAAELQDLIAVLRADLDRLSGTVTGLAGYTAAGFRVLSADLAALRADLSALRSEVTALAAQVASVNAALAALEARLQGQLDQVAADLRAQLQAVVNDVAALNASVTALGAQLATLQGQVAALTANLAALTATVAGLSSRLGNLGNLGGTVEQLLAGAAPGDLADALSDISALQTGLATVQGVLGGPGSGLVQQVNGLSAVVGGAGTGLVGAVAQLQATDVATAADITALETSMGNAEGAIADLETLVSGAGGLEADVLALQTTVGGAGSGLVQQVTGLQSDVDVLCGPTSLLDALC